MPRVLAIVNPASANGTTRRFWSEALPVLAQRELQLEEATTEGPGHAMELADQAVQQGFEIVLYVGGDGTANEVVNGLLRHRQGEPDARLPALAALPRGTGADFARGLALKPGAEAAAHRLLRQQERVIDVAHTSYFGRDGLPLERYFINIADAGLGGYVAEHANRRTKALGGFASFLWAVVASFWSYRKREMRVIVDGAIRHQGLVTTAVVANGPYFGGGMRMAPSAKPDDGILEVVVIGDIGKRDLVTNLHRLYRGTHLTHPKISSFQGKEVRVEGEDSIPLEMDGEQPGEAPWCVRVVPAALRVLV
jgi:YegS/Rv2252/BmrU family lipid kinase